MCLCDEVMMFVAGPLAEASVMRTTKVRAGRLPVSMYQIHVHGHICQVLERLIQQASHGLVKKMFIRGPDACAGAHFRQLIHTLLDRVS
jgi:hypothetical protein